MHHPGMWPRKTSRSSPSKRKKLKAFHSRRGGTSNAGMTRRRSLLAIYGVNIGTTSMMLLLVISGWYSLPLVIYAWVVIGDQGKSTNFPTIRTTSQILGKYCTSIHFVRRLANIPVHHVPPCPMLVLRSKLQASLIHLAAIQANTAPSLTPGGTPIIALPSS